MINLFREPQHAGELNQSELHLQENKNSSKILELLSKSQPKLAQV